MSRRPKKQGLADPRGRSLRYDGCMNWQKLNSDHFEVYRAAVPGGWLVLARDPQHGWARRASAGLTFLPDPDHAWNGLNPLASPLGLRA